MILLSYLGGSREAKACTSFWQKKRDIFTSKLLVYYVVLQVFNHIGISPSTPDTSLISERIHVHDFCSGTLQERSKYFKNNLCSFLFQGFYVFHKIGNSKIYMDSFISSYYTPASQVGRMWCCLIMSIGTVRPFVTPCGYTSLICYSSCIS